VGSTNEEGFAMSHATSGAVDVRALINQVLDETNLTSTADIIDKVMSMLAPEQLADALRQALTDVVRQQITRHNVGPLAPDQTGASRPSWKVHGYQTQVADAWRRVLRDRISVGRNERKMLGECTYADLTAAAEERFAHARQNEAKAQWLKRLADAVKQHDAARLDALPDDVLQALVTS
jgi:hypothetical protein